MSTAWLVVLIVGVATMCLKAMGPVLLGGRRLPERLEGVVALLAPALLAALVVTQVVGGDRRLEIDERLLGLAAAALAIAVRAPLLTAVAVAAVVAAAARALA